MKNFKTFCIGTVAILGLATGASAQTVSPNGTFTLSNVGTITVSKGITLNCSGLSGELVVASNDAEVTDLSLSGGLFGQCANITFTDFDYPLTATDTSSVTINNVVVEGITGNCAGNITGAWNDAADTITFTNAVLPRTSGTSSNCTINGTIKVSPALTYTVP
ncbi:hypothetical protein FPZ54_10855 [Sphingomonas suaedae]|uniref:Protein activator of alkane oxidation PraB n=1 Tax=Sphingomonas suaedae TaxID=2599297 RepID=A0A518RGE4_9SPHN|nr:hypothetical protein [Sphingomonas suaedae]QDX26474.1 hypothetical protein FPZ54_10855 [Sphingomonas suaedae]